MIGKQMMHLRLLFFLTALPVCLSAQTIVEHAVISGGTTAAAAAAKGAAGTIAGALKKLDSTLDTTAKAAAGPTENQPSPAPSPPARTYEDAAGIKPGLSAAELRQRFGDPSMRITGDDGDQTLYYTQKDGRGITLVRIAAGKVLSVDQPAKDAPVE